ncbi:long-chain fatty acid--CoA ligase [Streptomyces sp. AJS327]|uniref:class I adenylate-forming enzyme family protein n=1 Tax=Streptomyces sp. AJS327 TaxID=2545265 RepID=UPI0015DD78B4|nr:AMP-binding protein [Streptomyces sp. AJS327]MBA0052645.1 long-chain fatty acid--CoA ligase [Streptomyces sp. AJS327]
MHANGTWVDDLLLKGDDRHDVLYLSEPVSRGTLRRLVAERQRELTEAGLRPGGTLALRLPPSLDGVVALLAGWRGGAQVTLLDHRLTTYEVEQALTRLAPQLVVEPVEPVSGRLRGFFEISSRVVRRPTGRPARSEHVLLQLSSGSTGPSKVIGRTVLSLRDEIERYGTLDGFPRPGERVVVLASVVHVLGLVGGLLYGLAHGVRTVLPEHHSVDGILRAVAAAGEPTTLLGVPSHTALLTAAAAPPQLPQLHRMITGGEVLRTTVRERFTDRYGAELGAMYGMTEAGVIAADPRGGHHPALTPAPGMDVRVVDGEIQLALPESPYVGLLDPDRYVDGWLRTRDAGALDPATGLLTVHGRTDSQVSVAGLKVDLTEVEAALSTLDGVTDAVVVHGSGIEAYVTVAEPALADGLAARLADRLAAYKRPRALRILPELPRTATGKPIRNADTLRAATRSAAAE